MEHQDHMTERLSSVLYASENSRQVLVGKVQKLELDLVDATDETMSLRSRIQVLEAAANKSTRQMKFLQSQLEVIGLLCLSSRGSIEPLSRTY